MGALEGLVDEGESELFLVSLRVVFGGDVGVGVFVRSVAFSGSLLEMLLFDSVALLDTPLVSVTLDSLGKLDGVGFESVFVEGFVSVLLAVGVGSFFEGAVVVVGDLLLGVVLFVVVAGGEGVAFSAEEGDKKGDDEGPLPGA